MPVKMIVWDNLPNNDETMQKIKDTKFLVEANGNEKHMLWKEFAPDGAKYLRHLGDDASRRVKSWEQDNCVFTPTIGYIYRRPINVQLIWSIIEGQRVCFYTSVSQLVDWELVDRWIKHHFPQCFPEGKRARHTDAQNFHNCLGPVRQMAEGHEPN